MRTPRKPKNVKTTFFFLKKKMHIQARWSETFHQELYWRLNL